jgi:Tol biopolymer transport system component
MTISAGARLGPYEILAPLGAGGMGEVYRARDTRLDRAVAVKVLPSHLARDEGRRARFEREARAVSALNHPHICTLFDIGQQDGVDYIVMEYLEGETLAERLAKGPLPLEQSLRLGEQIAGALDKAHRAGIVHRDLKPGNVFLTKAGAKLLDFGLARVTDASGIAGGLSTDPTQAKPLTEAGSLLGTFQYMAPEQLEGREADARTDVFALGSVLYEMVTGKRAFEGKSQASLIGAILKDEPPPISKVQPMTPSALDRLVRRCLAKDPDERWQSAADVADELKWIAESGSRDGAAAAVPPRGRSRERLAWTAAGLLLLASLYLARNALGPMTGAPRAIHAFLMAPEKTSFLLTGDEGAPMVVSPDGQRVAFGAGGRLWVHSLRNGAAVALSSTEGGRFPFWSPDSRFLGFFSEGKLRTVEASGGPVLQLCDAPNPRGGAWSRSGVIVFTPDIRTGLWRVRASGGEPTPLTRIDGTPHSTHRWPSFLPDGRHVLYLAANHASPRNEQSGIYVASLEGGEPRRLMPSWGSAQYASGFLLFVREASLLAQRFDPGTLTLSGEPVRLADEVGFDTGVWRGTFSASENGILAYHVVAGGVGGQFTWLDRVGRSLEKVAERSEAYVPALSPDGRRLAFLIGDPSNDIWVQELDRRIRTRVTTLGGVTASPLWSPDGSEILFVTQDQNEFTLAATPVGGAGQRRVLYRSPERMEPTDRSRDGRFLLYDKGNVGLTDVWALPLAEPAKAFSLVSTPFVDRNGRFSPDGRWVAYSSRETGRDEVYVTSFPDAGTRLQVSGGGGKTPRWRADGRELFFLSGDALMAAAVDNTGPRLAVKEVKPLFRVNLYNGPRTNLTAYDVSPDGQRFLVNTAGDAGDPRVGLVTNWMAELSR